MTPCSVNANNDTGTAQNAKEIEMKILSYRTIYTFLWQEADSYMGKKKKKKNHIILTGYMTVKTCF